VARPNLTQLEKEMAAVGVSVNGLGEVEGEVFTYTSGGERKQLSAAEEAVVEAHVPVPNVDPRIAKIDGMGLDPVDRATLKELLGIG
jgi:hypothetical protein